MGRRIERLVVSFSGPLLARLKVVGWAAALAICSLLSPADMRHARGTEDEDAAARQALSAWHAGDQEGLTAAGRELIAKSKSGTLPVNALSIDALSVVTLHRMLEQSDGPTGAEEAARVLLAQTATVFPEGLHERMAQLGLAATICKGQHWQEVAALLQNDSSHKQPPSDHLSADVAIYLMMIGSLVLSPSCIGVTEELYRLAFRILKPEEIEPSLTRLLGGPQKGFIALITAGWVLELDGDPAAEAIYRRALSLATQSPGSGLQEMAGLLSGLGGLLRQSGRLEEAETAGRRAVNLLEAALGPNDPSLASIGLVSLGTTLLYRGRYAEAEAVQRRALSILVSDDSADALAWSRSLSGLATTLHAQGRDLEAEALYRRALDRKDAAANSAEMAGVLGSFADVELSLGQIEEAEALQRRAIAIEESLAAGDQLHLAASLQGLAEIVAWQKRFDEAEALYRRALSIREAMLGPDHLDLAGPLLGLAQIAQRRGKIDESRPLLLRVLAIEQAALGPDHPELVEVYERLAIADRYQGHLDLALVAARAATMIIAQRIEDASRFDPQSIGNVSRNDNLGWHVALLADAVAGGDPENRLANEAFMVGQVAQLTEASVAFNQLGMRFAAGNTGLAEAVRSYQDALAERRALEELLVQAVSRPQGERSEAEELGLRDRLAAADRAIAQVEARFRGEFPDYAALAFPAAWSFTDVQGLLAPDEALISYLTSPLGTYLWIVTKGAVRFQRVAVNQSTLAEKIKRLRQPLDATNIVSVANIRPFDAALAHELYETLLAPAEDMLAGVHHLMIVPHGPLEGLPFAVLVGKAPPGPLATWKDYQDVDWLARRFALTTLPSVGALESLRSRHKGQAGSQPFIGFGDPLLDGHPAEAEEAASRGSLFRAGASGLLADPATVRQLPPLPDTAGELLTMATELGGDSGSVYLQERATERRVKTMDLTQVRVLAFATHGLVAGDIGQLGEPALVLTPPAEGTAEDDGLLTASEVASLRLNADWVVLSACNTAAPDGEPGAKGLSGLARAFFYAGARALLVSHWPVVSAAAAAITTGAARELEKDPGIGRAEALRRAMLTLADDRTRPYYAHPLFWAPFTIVGEGR